ncbi:MAG: hypothetical protein WBM16_14895, partial [Pseudolabrys sp.]
MTAITVKQARRLYPVIDPRQFVVAGGGLRITMNEITKQSDTLPVVEKIQNIETEILPLEIQNIDAP